MTKTYHLRDIDDKLFCKCLAVAFFTDTNASMYDLITAIWTDIDGKLISAKIDKLYDYIHSSGRLWTEGLEFIGINEDDFSAYERVREQLRAMSKEVFQNFAGTWNE